MLRRSNWFAMRCAKSFQFFCEGWLQPSSAIANKRGTAIYCMRSREGIHSHQMFPCTPLTNACCSEVNPSIAGLKL